MAAPDLFRAVLEDAVGCLLGRVGAAHDRPRLAAETLAWVRGEPCALPFERVCDGLGLDARRLRPRLLALYRPVLVPVVPRVGGRQRRAVPLAEVGAMIRGGHPLAVVAARFGVSMATVSRHSAQLASRVKDERNDRVRALHREGWTVRALRQQFRLSRTQVMRICRAHGPRQGKVAA